MEHSRSSTVPIKAKLVTRCSKYLVAGTVSQISIKVYAAEYKMSILYSLMTERIKQHKGLLLIYPNCCWDIIREEKSKLSYTQSN